MPKGYVIFTELVNDPERMQAYFGAAAPTIVETGAKVLVVDGDPQVLEGEWHGNQTVVLEFESVDAARAWYESAPYGEAKLLRQTAAVTNAVIVAGFGD
jgi:uncharacterized protein (DUF1330 family)